MSKMIRICIQDTDRCYAQALAAGLSELDRSFRVSVCDSFNQKDADVLLSDREIVRPEVPYILLDTPLRYAGVLKVASQIRMTLIRTGANPACDGSWGNETGMTAAVVSFIGVEGGAGTSSIALGCARELSRYRNKKVLYLSLEPLESDRLCVEKHSDAVSSIDDYLFEFLKDDGACAEDELKTFLIKDSYGVMRFNPSGRENRLAELDDALLIRFTRLSAAASEADYLIIDCSCANHLPHLSVPETAGAQVYVAAAGGLKSRGDAGYVRELCNIDGTGAYAEEGAGESIVVINRQTCSDDDFEEEQGYKNKKDAAAPAGQSAGMAVYIDEDPGSFEITENGVDISLTNTFGTGIKELVDKLTEPGGYDEQR
jgi:hypothetical protein